MAREFRHQGRSLGPTVEPEETAIIDSDELRARVAADARNRWVALPDLSRARLHRGLMTATLRARSTDGSRLTLMWLKHDPAYAILSEVFGERLGANLRVKASRER
jgi:hypothetical protein